jgi:predicted metal-binding transcription factor (methanogenesis marker protein 9)
MLTDIDLDQQELSPEMQRIIDHRLRWLLDAGYKTRNAERIADALAVDWHFARDLLKNGCDERTAMKILF